MWPRTVASITDVSHNFRGWYIFFPAEGSAMQWYKAEEAVNT